MERLNLTSKENHAPNNKKYQINHNNLKKKRGQQVAVQLWQHSRSIFRLGATDALQPLAAAGRRHRSPSSHFRWVLGALKHAKFENLKGSPLTIFIPRSILHFIM